jgi:two-component system, response regulator FlrC
LNTTANKLHNKNSRALITRDPVMRKILEICEIVAVSNATILLQGESGTGKEVISRFIHSSSERCKNPFIAVNCAALPNNLLESELFGHEKGSFTGAFAKKIGKFEQAEGGTLLLDEISEMDIILQAKLLRVIQEREVDRVGGTEPIPVNVRIIATTNRNILEMTKVGTFRLDLYYRLNVVPITLPPLRERRGDIKCLIEYFMNKYIGNNPPCLPNEVLDKLINYNWPGNIRELQNAVERAAILSAGKIPLAEDFLLQSDNSFFNSNEKKIDLNISSGMTVADVERTLIIETLKSEDYNRTKAAKLLGISVRTLRNKITEYQQSGFTLQEEF